MGAARFFEALSALMRILAEAWAESRRRRALAAAQADADRIGACPADEWLRRFNEQAAPATKADTDQPAGDE